MQSSRENSPKEKSLHSLRSIESKFQEAKIKQGVNELFIFVPVCVYAETDKKLPTEDFYILVENLISYKEKTPHCNFGIYFFESESNPAAVSAWRKANESALQKLGDYGIRVPEWRKKNIEKRLETQKMYEKFLENEQRKDEMERELKKDSDAFLTRDKNKKNPIQDIRDHVIRETIDTIIHAERLSNPNEQSQAPSRLTVILHAGPIHATTRHAMAHLSEIGFVNQSMIYQPLKIKDVADIERLPNRKKPQNDTSEELSTSPPALDTFFRIALEQFMRTKNAVEQKLITNVLVDVIKIYDEQNGPVNTTSNIMMRLSDKDLQSSVKRKTVVGQATINRECLMTDSLKGFGGIFNSKEILPPPQIVSPLTKSLSSTNLCK